MTIPLEFTCLDAQAATYDNVLTLTADHVITGVDANPVAVWFRVTSVSGAAAGGPGAGTRDPQFHDILYQWDFGDPNNATPTTALNMPDAWKDLNTGYGREVCHVYNDAGAHPVTVYAYEPATRRFGSLTFDVTIEDANTAFFGTNTIIFNPGGLADTSLYPQANVITTTWDAVIAARGAKAGTPCRILIAPGVTITDTQLANPNNWSNIRIGALDPANKPVIVVDAMTTALLQDWDFDNRETLLYDLDFRGPWDSTTETGRIIDPVSSRKGEGFTGNFLFCVYRCTFDGWGDLQGCQATGSAQDTYNVICDTEITNWQNYGIFQGDSGRGKLAVVGCSIHQHEDALSGGPKNGMHNNHGPLRDGFSKYMYVDACDLFSRCGWSTGGTDAQGFGVTYDQPCIRPNTGGTPDAFSYVSRCAVEGWLDYNIGAGTKVGIPGNHVIDKMLQVIGSRVNGFQTNELTFGGTTVRNLLAVKLNLPEASSLVTQHLIYALNHADAVGNDDGMAFHNITFLDLRDDTTAQSQEVRLYRGPTDRGIGLPAQDFTNLLQENNVLVQPARTGVNTQDEPLDLTTPVPGFSPRHKGPRWNFQHYETTLTAPVSGAGGTLDILYAEVPDGRGNTGNPTSQAYWQAIQSTDQHHRARINGSDLTTYHADLGQIAVSFGADAITLTNTSGTDWQAGDNLRLRLDRRSYFAPFDPQFDSTTQIVPLAKPLTGSQAIGTGGAGRRAYDDLLLGVRPNENGERGALNCT